MNKNEMLVALLVGDDCNDPRFIGARAYAEAQVELKDFDPGEARDLKGRWTRLGPGKHELVIGGHTLLAIRRNDAAGGSKYEVRHTNPRGETRIIARGDRLHDVQSQAELSFGPSRQVRGDRRNPNSGGRRSDLPARTKPTVAVRREEEIRRLRENQASREPVVREKLQRDAQRAMDNREALKRLAALPVGKIVAIRDGFLSRRPDGKFDVHVGTRIMVLSLSGAARYASGTAYESR